MGLSIFQKCMGHMCLLCCEIVICAFVYFLLSGLSFYVIICRIIHIETLFLCQLELPRPLPVYGLSFNFAYCMSMNEQKFLI